MGKLSLKRCLSDDEEIGEDYRIARPREVAMGSKGSSGWKNILTIGSTSSGMSALERIKVSQFYVQQR